MVKRIKRIILIYTLLCLFLFIGFTGRNCVQSNGENDAYGIATAVFLAVVCRFGQSRFGDQCRYF